MEPDSGLSDGTGTNRTRGKERLDVLVQRLAGVSRAEAQALILAGAVYNTKGQRLDKCGLRLAVDTLLDIRSRRKYVSRGGEKLEAALQAFCISVAGCRAMDVGASTGGFTDCLLQHGVAKVYAIDVGYGQLAWKLRTDPRVVVMERTNIRTVRPEMFDDTIDFFVVDCSFISLGLVLPCVSNVVCKDAQGVILVKPQFEAGREKVGKGGVVRDPMVHDEVIERVKGFAVANGFDVRGVVPSPLLGPSGNREFLMYLSTVSS